jgi:hypothetical protein
VEYRDSKVPYQVLPQTLISLPSKNLYAFATERALRILGGKGRIGIVLPLAATTVSAATSFRNVIATSLSTVWHSGYGFRPAKLFDGVNLRILILLGLNKDVSPPHVFSTPYMLFSSEERQQLFARLSYLQSPDEHANRFPKLGQSIELSILTRVVSQRATIASLLAPRSQSSLVYHRSPLYWIRALDFEPYFESETESRSIHHLRSLFPATREAAGFVGSVLNSSLFFYWFIVFGNCRNLTEEDVRSFPCGTPSPKVLARTGSLLKRLMDDYKSKADITVRYNCKYQTFYPSRSKAVLDQIDDALANYFGFTPEELDFIINYDIKYRMGQDGGEDDE